MTPTLNFESNQSMRGNDQSLSVDIGGRGEFSNL